MRCELREVRVAAGCDSRCARSRAARRPSACRTPRSGPAALGTIDRGDVQLARDLQRVQRPCAARWPRARSRAGRSRARPTRRAPRATSWRRRSGRCRARPPRRVMPSGAADRAAIGRRAPRRASSGISPPRKRLAADAAEHHVGVRDRGLGRRRAGSRPGRASAPALRGPTFSAPDLVDPGDAAAAGADLDDVDDRQHHRVAAGVAADVVALGDRRLAVADQARLGRRAAHVEGDRRSRSRAACRLRPRRSRRRRARTPSSPPARPGGRAGDITPPLDCMISSRPRSRRSSSRAPDRRGSCSSAGRCRRSSTVVDVRSYSRYSRRISCDSET